MSTSFPYFSIATEFRIPYGTVLQNVARVEILDDEHISRLRSIAMPPILERITAAVMSERLRRRDAAQP